MKNGAYPQQGIWLMGVEPTDPVGSTADPKSILEPIPRATWCG